MRDKVHCEVLESGAIRKQLEELAEPQYAAFSARLLPGTEHILGVRIPTLRKMAKQITKQLQSEVSDNLSRQTEVNNQDRYNKKQDEALRNERHPALRACTVPLYQYLQQAGTGSFEEITLQGFVIGYSKLDTEELLYFINQFLPLIDNWSVCDGFCSGIQVTKANQEQIWEFMIKQISQSEQSPYAVRFAVVMMLNHYINSDYIDKILPALDSIITNHYYVNMGIAWCISMCFVKFPQQTMQYLENNNLNQFTYNKCLQKICESYQVDTETKIMIKSMKQ